MTFLGLFAELRKTTIGVVMSVLQSVCPHGKTWPPPTGQILFVILEYFLEKKSLENSIFTNHLNAELNPTCHLLALLEAHHILHVSRIRLTFKIPCVLPQDSL